MPDKTDTKLQAKPALEITDLHHSFKKHKALEGLTFSVPEGVIQGFVGPNGAGKTTALKIISTLLKPQRGTVRVFGHDIKHEYKKVRQRIGYMPDHFSMYRQMTVFEYLDFFAAAYGLTLGQRNTVIDDVLTLTDMDVRRNDMTKGLSRGMQQRLSLARVLVHDPDLLLLDEPASGLDPRARIELMEILGELRKLGKTIFISSHILSELAEICDSVTILDRGVVKYNGSIHDLSNRDTGTSGFAITVSKPSAILLGILQQQEGVTEVTADDEGRKFDITIDIAAISVNSLLQLVIDSGAMIQTLQSDKRQLNEAFMDLTEGGVRT